MKKLLFILIVLIPSLTMGQNLRPSYFKIDYNYQIIREYNLIATIDSIIDFVDFKEFEIFQNDFTTQLTTQEAYWLRDNFKNRNLSNRLSIHFFTSNDYQSFYVSGITPQYVIVDTKKAFHKDGVNYNRNRSSNGWTNLPLSSLANHLDHSKMGSLDNLIKRTIVDGIKDDDLYLKDTTINIIEFSEMETIELIGLLDNCDLDNFIYSPIHLFSDPLEKNALTRLGVTNYFTRIDSIPIYIDTVSQPIMTHSIHENKIVGMKFKIDLNVKNEKIGKNGITSIYQYEILTDLIGLELQDYEGLRKTIWFRKKKFLNHFNDSVFENGLKYLLSKKIKSKIIKTR